MPYPDTTVASLQVSTGHRLRFTADTSEEEFARICNRHPHWYHSYYFDNGFAVQGDYDIGADIVDYGFPKSMAGMRVLDVGTGAGWFAHYFEQLGADVTTVDARGYCDFDVYGRHFNPLPLDERMEPDRHDEWGNPVYHSPVSGAFWVMKDLLGSRIQFVNSKIYDLRPGLFGNQNFDLVFMGAILCHLRDPIGALMAARKVCCGEIVATTPVVIGEPEDEVMPRQYLPYTDVDRISWWLPNEACFRHWFSGAGFRNVDIGTSVTLRCDLARRDSNGRVLNGDQTLRLGRASV